MKLLFENWRRFIKEEITATRPRPSRARRGLDRTRAVSKSKAASRLAHSFFKVLLDDPETFDQVPEVVNFADFKKDIEEEIENIIVSFSKLGDIALPAHGPSREEFLEYIEGLPSKEKTSCFACHGHGKHQVFQWN